MIIPRYFLLLSLCVLFFVNVETIFGHGIGSETLPPVQFEGKLVTLEVSSSTNPDNNSKEIFLAFIDADSKVTIKNTVFDVVAKNSDKLIFNDSFRSNDGTLTFVFENGDKEISVSETGDSFFDNLLGAAKKIHVKGQDLGDGGLYSFEIKISSADGYEKKLSSPLEFKTAISIQRDFDFIVNDENFGAQNIRIITYYDQIRDFVYDDKKIQFSMPFDWSEETIGQTSVVHEELIIPKSFGDILAPDYNVTINGDHISESSISVDDFSESFRTVHVVVSQKDLLSLYNKNKQVKEMKFELIPITDEYMMAAVTENGQYKVKLSYSPISLSSGQKAQLSLGIFDVFLSDKPISVNFQLKIIQGNDLIYSGTGNSQVDNIPTVIEFDVPDNANGAAIVSIEKINDKNLANAQLPLIFNRIQEAGTDDIPSWIKNTAGWWAQDMVEDTDFIKGLEFLIQKDIIKVRTEFTSSSTNYDIPSWIKNTAGWWAQDMVEDTDFIKGLEFLIQKGIIHV